MTFNNLHQDVPQNCSCIENATIIKENQIYTRFLKYPEIESRYFETHWEKWTKKGKIPTFVKQNDCANICLYKNASVDNYTDENRAWIINYYLKQFRVTQKDKNAILVFQLKPKAGLIEHTPSEKNPFHHSFFKEDEFSIDSIEIIELIELKNENI